jgi:hypothetical protein
MIRLININTISVIKRWASHVARMGEKRNAHKILVENPEDELRDLGIGGRIILK